ncbi:MAG: 3-hydroxybutyrate dehydrogenase [Spirochaetales bacterium]|jgi:3-hydroxybutyrate dehydrogenase|nr:3-hydroxybutyrate dehydrogenase [Spirochaetales bacterium]
MSAKTVLLTGAGSGIGRGLMCGLAEFGFRVIGTDKNADQACESAELVREKGGEADSFALDVTDETDLSRLPEKFADSSLDVLINNAGLQYVSPLEDFPDEIWDLLIRVMLIGSARMTKLALPIMRRSGFGRIINIGSVHSLVASPFKTAYVAAKHGLLGLSKTIALETADCDITMNTICPAYVKTPLVEKQIANQAKSHGISEDEVINEIMLKPMPKGAFISIEELTGIAKFLISDAARNITGQEITVDGGWTIR